LKFIADDIQKLIDQFYPKPERIASGWMIFTGTKATGPKPSPGQSASDHELVTIAWPVLFLEDIEELTTLSNTKQEKGKWLTKRLIRIIDYGDNHQLGPVLLTLAELALMVGISTVDVSLLLKDARKQTGKPLLTKGLFFDQGMRPTHKTEIIELYEKGVDQADIARRSNHAIKSVGRYINDYERVKLLLKREIPVEQINILLHMQIGVIKAYAKMVEKYHPKIMKNYEKVKISE